MLKNYVKPHDARQGIVGVPTNLRPAEIPLVVFSAQ
jgi:hypothetical protein